MFFTIAPVNLVETTIHKQNIYRSLQPGVTVGIKYQIELYQ